MATIRIDVTRRIGHVNPLIYGSMLEHGGHCIYGGVVDTEASIEVGTCVLRQDSLAAVATLRPPILRWPGGNFASAYHWLDGVGPVKQRPGRLLFSSSGEESNLFGTAEFLDYCRQVGAAPYLCLNLGTGSIDEATAWVEYCNGTGNTAWANLRRSHGYPEPFQVRYWGLGNEQYGAWQIGAKSAPEYLALARETAKAVRRVDPTVQLVGCGLDGLSDWDLAVLDGLGEEVAYHSIHLYTGHPDYYQNVFMPHQAERALRVVGGLLERSDYQQRRATPRQIAFDEWNVWYRAFDFPWEEAYDLSDALGVATFLNIFHRQCHTVTMACMAQLVNVLAPIMATPTGIHCQTTFWPYLLYRRHCQSIALDVFVESPVHILAPLPMGTTTGPAPHHIADLGPFPYLDVSATVDEHNEHLTLAVINRHLEEPIETWLEIQGITVAPEGRWYVVDGPDIRAGNSAATPDQVGIQEGAFQAGERFRYRFVAHSITLLTLRCRPTA